MPLFHGPAVNIRCVEEIDPQLKGAVHDLEAVLFGCVPSEIHGPQTELTDQYAMFTQTPVFDRHGSHG
jgi:hypothetical protein